MSLYKISRAIFVIVDCYDCFKSSITKLQVSRAVSFRMTPFSFADDLNWTFLRNIIFIFFLEREFTQFSVYGLVVCQYDYLWFWGEDLKYPFSKTSRSQQILVEEISNFKSRFLQKKRQNFLTEQILHMLLMRIKKIWRLCINNLNVAIMLYNWNFFHVAQFSLEDKQRLGLWELRSWSSSSIRTYYSHIKQIGCECK